jgi:hypothetical protein
MEANAEQDIITPLAPEVGLEITAPDRTPGHSLPREVRLRPYWRHITKDQELEVIRSGQIHYKDIDSQEVSVRFIGGTTPSS